MRIVTITKVSTNGNNVVVSVMYQDGDIIDREDIPGNDLDSEKLASFVAKRVTIYDQRDTAFAALKPLEGQPVPSPKTPDPAIQEANEFFATVAKLNAIKASVEKGTTPLDDQAVADLTATVKQGLVDHPEYLSDFRWR